MYRRIHSTEALVINDLRSPSNEFDGTFDQLIIYSLLWKKFRVNLIYPCHPFFYLLLLFEYYKCITNFQNFQFILKDIFLKLNWREFENR